MSEASLSARILSYKKVLANKEIQQTYQALVSIIQKLRSEFIQRYKEEYSVAAVLHGYIDFTYFYLQNDFLKQHKLKLAIVLNHQKAHFELWLLGQTKNVQIRYWQKLKDTKWVNEEAMPEYSIFETTLLANPDFDDLVTLSKAIHCNFTILSQEIFSTLAADK